MSGLSDGKSSGKPAKFTATIEQFLQQLLEQNRVWNSAVLAEEIRTNYDVKLSDEAVRLKLIELGFSWKRTRYAPAKTPDPMIVGEHKAQLEALKRGHWIKH